MSNNTSNSDSSTRDWGKITRFTLRTIWTVAVIFFLTQIGVIKGLYTHTSHVAHGATVIQVTDATGTTDEHRGEVNKAGDRIKTEIKIIKYKKLNGDSDTALNENHRVLFKVDDSTIGGIASDISGEYKSNNDRGWAIAYPSGWRFTFVRYWPLSIFFDNSLKWNIVNLERLKVTPLEGESYRDAALRAAADVHWWHWRASNFVSLGIATCLWFITLFLLWAIPRRVRLWRRGDIPFTELILPLPWPKFWIGMVTGKK